MGSSCLNRIPQYSNIINYKNELFPNFHGVPIFWMVSCDSNRSDEKNAKIVRPNSLKLVVVAFPLFENSTMIGLQVSG